MGKGVGGNQLESVIDALRTHQLSSLVLTNPTRPHPLPHYRLPAILSNVGHHLATAHPGHFQEPDQSHLPHSFLLLHLNLPSLLNNLPHSPSSHLHTQLHIPPL
jgi:hypothetical protein